jgi:hypothetical protein
MPIILKEPTDWETKAGEVRQMAHNEREPTTKMWLEGVASEHERLASMAQKRREGSPLALSPSVRSNKFRGRSSVAEHHFSQVAAQDRFRPFTPIGPPTPP